MSADRDPAQAWFWTPEWQAGEREADRDIAAGRVQRMTAEEFLAAMRPGCSRICGDHDCTGCAPVSPAAEIGLGVVVLLALIAVSWALLWLVS